MKEGFVDLFFICEINDKRSGKNQVFILNMIFLN